MCGRVCKYDGVSVPWADYERWANGRDLNENYNQLVGIMVTYSAV